MLDYLICPICGCKKKNLTKHIQMKHNITKDDFLQMFPGTQMIADTTSQKISNALKENWKNDDYAEKCSVYWRSELHRQRKSEDMTFQWQDSNWRQNTLTCMHNITECQRNARSKSLTKVLYRLWNTDFEYVERRRLSGRQQMEKNMQDACWAFPKRYEYQGNFFRSKLEVKFAQLFERLGITYEYEVVKLPYVDCQGISRTYYVDFYLPDYNVLVEVKPEVFLYELYQGKLIAATNSQYDYYILTDKDTTIEKIKLKLPMLNCEDKV